MNSFSYHLKTILIGAVFGPAFAIGYLYQIARIGFMFGRDQSMTLQEQMVEEAKRRDEAAIQKEMTKIADSSGHFLGIM